MKNKLFKLVLFYSALSISFSLIASHGYSSNGRARDGKNGIDNFHENGNGQDGQHGENGSNGNDGGHGGNGGHSDSGQGGRGGDGGNAD